jgi:lipoprotein-anchoring transpeptidase ErfK/SrfK
MVAFEGYSSNLDTETVDEWEHTMPKRIEVNLGRQVLLAYDGATKVYEFDCVSGDDDNPTPRGRFSVNRKRHPYTSHKYHVPMNHAMFFTHTGEAIHQGVAVGPLSYLKWAGISSIGSHGCVRLSEDHATALYTWTPLGTPVHVF